MTTSIKYSKLFSPITINKLFVKNRIVATPTNADFYEKAAGGAGIVICGNTIVDYGRSSFASPDEPYLFEKYSVEGAQQRIRECHAGGARASIEIMHAGQYARVKEYAVGPVGFTREDGIEVKEMDLEMMNHAADCYATAANDAKSLGFDMIFLHFGHGWLPAQFLSPLFNKRNDEFGGNLENRMKFPTMILERVRQAVGPNFPIDLRISAVEWVEGSIDFSDTLEFIKSIEHLIDTVQISAGLDINHEGNVHCIPTNFKEHMPNAEYARIVKNSVKIPVSVVGAIMSAEEANNLIEDGSADIVAFGRSFIADPMWPRKALNGQEEDIIPCLRCNQCYHIASDRRNWGCSVNPRYRNESFVPEELTLTEKVNKVLVIGGGVAGMNAALAASKRGNEVILLEKENYLGGSIYYVSKEHYKEDIRRYLVYLTGKIKRSNVDIRLNTYANREYIENIKPDSIIIASGSIPITPNIEGIEMPHVIGFNEAIKRSSELKEDIIIIGGGTIGAEIALEQAEIHNNNVTIIEMTSELASQGNMLYRIALRQKIEVQKNLNIFYNSKCTKIEKDSVIVEDINGETKKIHGKHVIIATGVKPNNKYVELFNDLAANIYTVGDVNSPRKIMEAVFEGHTVGSIV